MKKHKWFIGGGALLILLFLLSAILFPAYPKLSLLRTKQNESNVKLEGIGRLVLSYIKTHNGALPQKLSDVLPQNTYYDLDMFQVSEVMKRRSITEHITNISLIDQHADFMFPAKANSGILVFEKPWLWSDGSVAACYKDLTIKRLTSEDFSALMPQLLPVNGNQ